MDAGEKRLKMELDAHVVWKAYRFDALSTELSTKEMAA